MTYWEKNWRKGGLQDRRGELIKINNFYNQQWCGCEFSMGHMVQNRDKIEEKNLPDFLKKAPQTRSRLADGANRISRAMPYC